MVRPEAAAAVVMVASTGISLTGELALTGIRKEF